MKPVQYCSPLNIDILCILYLDGRHTHSSGSSGGWPLVLVCAYYAAAPVMIRSMQRDRTRNPADSVYQFSFPHTHTCMDELSDIQAHLCSTPND